MKLQEMLKNMVAALLLAAVAVSAAACSEPPAESETDDTKTGTDSIFAVEYRDVTIELGEDAETVLDQLGEPKSKQFVASCGEGAGDQWMYDFGSVILYTVKADDEETVDAVVLRDDSAETVDGITIGSTEADMEKAYGEPTENGQKRRYTKKSNTLEFQVDENEKIVAVELRVES